MGEAQCCRKRKDAGITVRMVFITREKDCRMRAWMRLKVLCGVYGAVRRENTVKIQIQRMPDSRSVPDSEAGDS